MEGVKETTKELQGMLQYLFAALLWQKKEDYKNKKPQKVDTREDDQRRDQCFLPLVPQC